MEKLLKLSLPLIRRFPFKLLSFATLYLFTNRKPPKTQHGLAEIALQFLLSNLKQLILQHARLILDSKNQVEMLECDVCLFKAFLKDLAKRPLRNDAVEEFARQVKGVVRQGECVIGAFVDLAGRRRDRDFWKKLGFGGMIKLIGVAKEVATVRIKVKGIYSKVKSINFGATQTRVLPEEAKKTKNLLVRQDNVVVEETEVVTIIRVPRPGKMALTQKICHDLRTALEVPICEYRVFVSQGQKADQESLSQRQCAHVVKGKFLIFSPQDVAAFFGWEGVPQMSFLRSRRETISNMVITASHGDKLHKGLLGSVCLIFVDDVWSSQSYDQLRMLVPNNSYGSRILATCWMKNIVVHFSYYRPHEMEFLDECKSWNLP